MSGVMILDNFDGIIKIVSCVFMNYVFSLYLYLLWVSSYFRAIEILQIKVNIYQAMVNDILYMIMFKWLSSNSNTNYQRITETTYIDFTGLEFSELKMILVGEYIYILDFENCKI